MDFIPAVQRKSRQLFGFGLGCILPFFHFDPVQFSSDDDVVSYRNHLHQKHPVFPDTKPFHGRVFTDP